LRRIRKLKVISEIAILVGFDLIFFAISLLFAYGFSAIFIDFGEFNLDDLSSYWWISLIFIIAFAKEGLYTKRLPFWDETQRLFKYITTAILVVFIVIIFADFNQDMPKLTLLFLWLFSIVIFPIGKFIIKHIMYKFDFFKRKVLVIGAGSAGKAAVKELGNQDYLGTKVIGFLDDDDEKLGKSYKIGKKKFKVLGKVKDFEKIADERAIQFAILALPTLPAKKLSKLIVKIQRRVRELVIVPEIKGVSPLNTETFHVYDLDLMMLKVNNNVRSTFNRFAKRSFDIVVSLALLPFILPIIGILAYFIKKESPGDVFYAHNRVGKDGRIIPVLKFRSMYSDSKERLEKLLESDPAIREEWEKNFKLKNDPRVTKIGKFIRESSLDELPQIFNVLKGEMSLVGPRPVVEEELKKYYKESAEYYKMVKPGITGFWQVSGRSDTDYDFRVKVDTWYVYNWSLWLDIMVLIKTVRVVLLKEGAY
jgi:undecaprenyl-phosphate galactose phosphotransferase